MMSLDRTNAHSNTARVRVLCLRCTTNLAGIRFPTATAVVRVNTIITTGYATMDDEKMKRFRTNGSVETP